MAGNFTSVAMLLQPGYLTIKDCDRDDETYTLAVPDATSARLWRESRYLAD